MEKADRKNSEQSLVFWVSHSLKCLSFHPAPRFETMKFPDHSVMWQMVHELVQQGYVVQIE